MSARDVPFVPMPDPSFIADPNLRNMVRTLRANVMSAFGIQGGLGFMPYAKASLLSSGKTSNSSSGSVSASENASKIVQCAFDVSSGSGSEGTHYLPLVFPQRTVLARVFCVVLESFSGDAAATMSIRAGDGADEMVVFADSALDSAWLEGYHASINVGQSAGERARAFKVVVSGGGLTAGRMRIYAEHVRCEP